jgi:hypothetical protein
MKGNYLGNIYQREGALPLLEYTSKKYCNRELFICNNNLFIPTSK